MYYPPAQAALFLDTARNILQEAETDDTKFQKLWQALNFMHGMNLARIVKNRLGDRVYSGPFKGMRLTPAITSDNLGLGPYLLGSYEHELHPALERAIAGGYRQVLNIGCSFGYYSIGLARRLPEAIVCAFDIDENVRERCREMAALNEVTERVKIGAEFRGEDFAVYAGAKTLVVMDVEGAEMTLLDPIRYPALQKMDVIVELHDVFNPAISKTIRERFTATHDTELIRNRPPPSFVDLALGDECYVHPIDSAVLSWEGRGGPTPWGVFVSNSL